MDCSISMQAARRRVCQAFDPVTWTGTPLVLCLSLMLGACGGLGRTDAPARVDDRPAPPATVGGDRGSDTRIAVYTPPAQPPIARPQPKRAVAVLMRRAEDQRRAGDLDDATVSLERALRIAPDDAMLWHRLAAIRLDQRQYAMAVQMAAKSNALAIAGDRDLRARNWQVIAAAKRAQGDTRGARDAQQQGAALR